MSGLVLCWLAHPNPHPLAGLFAVDPLQSLLAVASGLHSRSCSTSYD